MLLCTIQPQICASGYTNRHTNQIVLVFYPPEACLINNKFRKLEKNSSLDLCSYSNSILRWLTFSNQPFIRPHPASEFNNWDCLLVLFLFALSLQGWTRDYGNRMCHIQLELLPQTSVHPRGYENLTKFPNMRKAK